jgi:hypothetical protein
MQLHMCPCVLTVQSCLCVCVSLLQLKRCQVPGVLLPLQGIEGSSVELIAAAADADGRAAMYGEFVCGLVLAGRSGCGAGRSRGVLVAVSSFGLFGHKWTVLFSCERQEVSGA